MKILVTGSSGLIGSEAVAHFDAQGHDVVGADNNMRRVFFGAAGDTLWNLDRLKKSKERAFEKVLESELGKSQSDALSRIIGLDRKSAGKATHLSDVVVSDVDGQLDVEYAKRMLKWLAESVGRSLELSTPADT